MPANSNSLLRHKTIDTCLRDTQNKYTLLDLINACTKALKEKNGKTEKGKCKVSLRTVQLDIQFMRNKQYGYGAPIEVYEQKYYRYKDKSYSIDKSGVKKESMENLHEAVEILKQYATFNGFEQIRNIVNVLNGEIISKMNNKKSVISYEKRKNPLGLEYFDTIHDAIIHKKALCIGYYSSRSNNIMQIIFYPMYLKEYRGRWYALGYKDGLNGVYKLPIDRIMDFSYSILPFPEELTFDENSYFNDIIGVTRLTGDVCEITFLVKNRLAPFIKLNPLHHSQTLCECRENGDMVFSINIIPNREFFTIIYENQPYIQIISPRDIGVQANSALLNIVDELPDYTRPDKSAENNAATDDWDDGFNLFSNL